MKRKKRRRWFLAFPVVIAAAGAGIYYYGSIQGAEDTSVQTASDLTYRKEKAAYGSVVLGITESGTISFGSHSQDISLPETVEVSSGSTESGSDTQSADTGSMDMQSMGASMGASMGGGMMGADTAGESGAMTGASSSGTSSSDGTGLEVEEVYVAVGQKIEAGDPVLKVTDESAQKFRSELENAKAAAELQVKQEEINVESKRAEAQYTYDMNLAEGETAQETYEATIASLESTVSQREEELEEASEAVAEYEEELAAGSDVEEELEEAELAYSEAEANLQLAENNLATQSIEAKQTYENAVTNYKYAEELYEIATDGLEDDLNDAKDSLADAEEALSEFDALMEDGMIYAEYGGTVTEIAYSAGDTLADGETLLTLTNDDEVTMAVMVAQDDISLISIGNSASVELTAYEKETFDAQVISIDTASSAGSSAVNYEVTVQLTGDTGKVYSGMTGNVIFPEETAEDVLYVSNQAIHQDGVRTYVKVMEEDGTVTETDVETGFSNGTDVEIISGLTEGQTVLIESQVNE